jgi:hypothetical protein
MVIVRISHGLGNQMFQYAAGRALSLANQAPLKLDLTHFATYHDRSYGLDRFQIVATPATEREITAISDCPPGQHKRGLARHWDRVRRVLMPSNRRYVLRDAGRDFDPQVLEVKGDIYMLGYWQSLGYVEAAAAVLRTELLHATPPSPENNQWLDLIRQQPSIAIHLRRGDYVNHSRFEMADPLTYYKTAFDRISERIPSLVAYIFSDDIPWAEANLKLPCPLHFISHNHTAPTEDLRLMSACSHQIIANSTFSWWAAWLNTNPAKIVCAPKTWFKTAPEARADILPSDWWRC